MLCSVCMGGGVQAADHHFNLMDSHMLCVIIACHSGHVQASYINGTINPANDIKALAEQVL